MQTKTINRMATFAISTLVAAPPVLADETDDVGLSIRLQGEQALHNMTRDLGFNWPMRKRSDKCLSQPTEAIGVAPLQNRYRLLWT